MDTGALLTQAAVDMIISSLKEAVVFFKHKGLRVSTIMLAGVEATSSVLPDVLSQISEETVIDPIGKFLQIKDVSLEKIHKYGIALGVAIRSTHPR